MNIEVHIERLVLDGLAVEWRDRPQLQAAVEAELTRLLSAGELRSEFLSGAALRALRGGEIQVPVKTTAGQLGNQIAHAVHSGIGGEPARAPAHLPSPPTGAGSTFS